MRALGYALSLSFLATACGGATTIPAGPADASAGMPTDGAAPTDTPAHDAPNVVTPDGAVVDAGDGSAPPSTDGSIIMDGGVIVDSGPPPPDVSTAIPTAP